MSAIKKIAGIIHRWLGLSAGLVVMLLGITGCLLVFETEIRQLTEPYRKVPVQQAPLLPPSVLKQAAEKHLHSGKALGIEYPGEGKAATAMYYDETNYELVFLDPYTANVLQYKNMPDDFFRIVLEGHYYLWLPHNIGKPVAATATLIFLAMIITGLVLWWPRNKAARKQRFTIKWNASWRRRNYDLHQVAGFYASWIAVFLAITGLVFGFEWFAKSVYWVSSGGEQMVEHRHPESDSTKPAAYTNMADHLWQMHLQQVGPGESLGVYFATGAAAPVEIVVNHRPGTYYNSDFYHYDQYSGKLLPASGSYAGKFAEASMADKIVRLNYDTHTGAVLGLAGKLLAFFASFVTASLPLTGFMIWWGRRKRKNKPVG